MDLQKFCQSLILKESDFDHPSQLHGIDHTYRVMSHVLFLATLHELFDEMRAAICAAFIHDMARKHDGYCTEHGEWAAREKLPLFRPLFTELGIKNKQFEAVSIAVKNHSLMDEIPKEHPAYFVTALLKDSDALDRIRLGDRNLDPRFLRLPKSKTQIDFAKKFYLTFDKINFSSFTDVLEYAKLINQK